MKFPILYSRSKAKKIIQWEVRALEDSVLVIHGQLDGEMIYNEVKVEAKNVGRSNETTLAQQAISEAKSKFKKKLDENYSESLKDVIANVKPKVLLPMLAHKYKDKKKRLNQETIVGLQPKLDGIRMTARWVDNELVTLSRKGKPLNVPYIKAELEAKLTKNMFVDGELFIHSLMVDCANIEVNPFQIVTKLVKKQQKVSIPEINDTYSVTSSDLEYHIYDMVDLELAGIPYSAREKDIEDLCRNGSHIFKVKTTWGNLTEGLVKFKHTQFIKDCYEGTIIRVEDCLYSFGHRSSQLLKYKDFHDSEFKIIGFGEGKGTRKGAVIWECVTVDNESFNCTIKGTVASQRALFEEAEEYIGRLLTIRYQELTSKGIPRFPVGISIRETWNA